ncbi:MraY family glycosyltransferase [Alkaliphilus transvaalensis]|uniref:hypothetical protein n=1 Tax=Alkaliphilus transvaalensis TaxID=114628 RepID=UPI00047BB3F2|nr:hypothetical protein [Alkaliphilus transvaalensis]
MDLFLVFITSLLTTYVALPFIKSMLVEGNLLKENYRREVIPVGMGITLIPVLLIQFCLISLIYEIHVNTLLLFLGGILTMAFVGMLDDLMGNRETSGFKGHLGSFLKGRLTTGGFKAIIGGMIASLIAFLVSPTIIQFIVNLLVIALMTNLINLLDLRPGRAIKSIFFLTLVFFFVGLTRESQLILAVVMGYCVVYFPMDIKGKAMMGDVGSNTLGVSLGIVAVLSFTFFLKGILLIGLLGIHLVSEKYSISKIIQKNGLLNYIDQLGRE